MTHGSKSKPKKLKDLLVTSGKQIKKNPRAVLYPSWTAPYKERRNLNTEVHRKPADQCHV